MDKDNLGKENDRRNTKKNKKKNYVIRDMNDEYVDYENEKKINLQDDIKYYQNMEYNELSLRVEVDSCNYNTIANLDNHLCNISSSIHYPPRQLRYLCAWAPGRARQGQDQGHAVHGHAEGLR